MSVLDRVVSDLRAIEAELAGGQATETSQVPEAPQATGTAQPNGVAL